MRTSVPNLPQTSTEKKLHVSVPGTGLVSEDFRHSFPCPQLVGFSSCVLKFKASLSYRARKTLPDPSHRLCNTHTFSNATDNICNLKFKSIAICAWNKSPVRLYNPFFSFQRRENNRDRIRGAGGEKFEASKYFLEYLFVFYI